MPPAGPTRKVTTVSRKVMGEDFVVLAEPLGVEFLEGEADEAVQLLAPLHEERVVGHVMGEGVLEHIGQLREERLFVDQLDRLELSEKFPQFGPGYRRAGRAADA